MRNTKKTKKSSGTGEFPGYTTPGVYGLTEYENGVFRAVLVYKKEQDWYLEAFKLFHYFLEDENPVDMHISITQLYFNMLQLADENKIFRDNDQRHYFHQLLEFLSKLAVERNLCLLNEAIIMREALKIRKNDPRN